MRMLIADDDQICCQVLAMHLALLGDCDTVGTGRGTIGAVTKAWDEGRPYGLVFLDILMPEGDGQEVLQQLRVLEKKRGIHGLDRLNVVMITSLDDRKQVMDAFRREAQAYLIKPVDATKLRKVLKEFGILGKDV